MKLTSSFLFICISLLFISCKKEAGESGKASIIGILYLKDYNGNFNSLELERVAYDEDVYIHYGDETSYSDKIKSSFDGRFEFKYLRPGKYKIYSYSKDPTDKDNVQPEEMMVVLREVEITSKKEVIELDTMFIYDN
ncbi:MAG: hypothetical protein V4622_00325 [Bacteroidota bacterium]